MPNVFKNKKGVALISTLFFLIIVTVLAYVWFTYAATEWRISIRRDMNAADTEANTKAVDSLLNFETVKYFGNEEHESRRYARSMESYEKAAIRTWVSLAVLNSGQAVVYSVGLTIVASSASSLPRRSANAEATLARGAFHG